MYNLQEIASATDLPVRTIRFYIQKGLVDRPDGARKTATYAGKHVEQLITIKRLSDSGLSLDGIAKILKGDASVLSPHQHTTPGQVRVVNQINICQGVDITIDPIQSGLSAQQIREIATYLMTTVEEQRRDVIIKN